VILGYKDVNFDPESSKNGQKKGALRLQIIFKIQQIRN